MEASIEGFNELLGVRFNGGEKGLYQLELTVGPQHHHDAGLVHGGVYLSLLDTVMSRAIRTLTEEAHYAPTVALSCNFFRPISTGLIYAEAKVVNQSRHLAFVEGSLRDELGRLLAGGSATFFLVEKPE
ncbi:PaaI family thioesterase [Dasania marina]|uniref:PaaI family thioesterase n=1 Tax=Dasania marina TaxID=471499 RepID=UPI0003710BDE|nr:PaaI family thioesterase [Dasania marina]